MQELLICSPAFEDGGWIPQRHSAYGDNISPELRLNGLCADAVSLVITVDDMGHPIHPGYNHWIAWNLPPVAIIPEGLPMGRVIERPLHAEQGRAYGKHCYRGPRPPFNWNHDYRFTVYALDTKLDLSADSNKAAALKAMDGHVLQTGVLTGRYRRRHK